MTGLTGNGARLHAFLNSDRARTVLDLVPSAMVVIDDKGIVLGFGKMAERMFGYQEADVLGRNVSMLMGSPHAENHDAYLRNYAETGMRRMIGTSRIENARHSDGHIFPVEMSIGETHVEGMHCYIGFLRQIGSGEQGEANSYSKLGELAHASRVASMGALATALAHELNQPLTTIANYMEGLGDVIGEWDSGEHRDEAQRIVRTCGDQALRAGQLIRRLREFIKGGEPRSVPVRVKDLVNESVTLALINGYKRAVHLDVVIPDDIPEVLVDPLQGQQVVFNLIRNAFEAMDAEHGDRHNLKISAGIGPPGLVECVVEDDGPGIDPEIIDRVFESFVTTKASGMGVGLAICRQIVEAHGGTIWLEQSTELGGAAFHFTLPSARQPDNGHG